MSVAVETPVFQGPFDLLLHLILQEEVDIYEISMNEIVDRYLVELDRMAEAGVQVDLDAATSFLMIAATLIELKSRRLLPDPDDVDLDEELAIWEERDLLLARLLECRTFKAAVIALEQLADSAARCAPRQAGVDERYQGLLPDLLENVGPDDIKAAFLRAIMPKPEPTLTLDHVNPIKVTVGDAVEELLDELPRLGRASFRELTVGLVDRIEIVVRFLAVLELYKQGLVDLAQVTTFGEILVEWVANTEQTAFAVANGIDAYEG